MNLLRTDIGRNTVLVSRNEGKIKGYESCSDLRAWCHDTRARDRHLREWIKCDMPNSMLSVSILARFLRTMTCRSRARTTPRCHPDCKSKVLLESICSSCHAIKDCLKTEPNFDKYFAEEEFETSHWPCDKCLDVLKSIKMFWKIITEKIFCINIPKMDDYDEIHDTCTDTVKSVAKLWEKEIVQQALIVKNITPLLSRCASLNKTENSCKKLYITKESNSCIPRPKVDMNKDLHLPTMSKVKSPTSSLQAQRTSGDNVDKSSSSFTKSINKTCHRVHKCTSVGVKMEDQACGTCNIQKEDEVLLVYKKNMEDLQQKCISHENEIAKLKRENNSLKSELQKFYKSPSWSTYISNAKVTNYDTTAIIPKPFESYVDDGRPDNVKNTDSEMIITMKNCRKKVGFRHVSLLQVLHKTNGPVMSTDDIEAPCCKKGDPLDLLNKVQDTFGKIVEREMMLVNNKNNCTRQSDIHASFYRLKNCKSAPSCSTVCSESISSDSNSANL